MEAIKKGKSRNDVARLVCVAVAVAAVCMAISGTVYYYTRASEFENELQNFKDKADDVASKLQMDFQAHMRDLRVVAERVGMYIEATGNIPPRPVYERICEAARANPLRIYVGISLILNITGAERGNFQEEIGLENNINNAIMYVPGSSEAAPLDSWYGTNLYTTIGNEAFAGFDPIRPGWTWSASPGFRNLLFRARDQGRVLSTSPQAFYNSITSNTVFFAFQAPIYVNADQLAPSWSAGVDKNASVIPAVYCRNDQLCPIGVNRSIADPHVSVVSQMTAVDVPVYGIPAQEASSVGNIRKLCYPAVMYANETTDTSGMPCQPILAQMGNVFADAVAYKKRMYYAGAISGSFYVDRVAWATLQRFRADEFLIAAEDVTGLAGFEFSAHTYAHDDEVTASPSYSWQAMVKRSNGTLPYVADQLKDTPVTTINTAWGPVSLQQTSYSASVWRYTGRDFSKGTFLFAIDPSTARRTQCQNSTYYNGYPLLICPPMLTFDAYKNLAPSEFSASFITVMGDRLWHIRVSTATSYAIPHNTSNFVLIGGLVTAALLSALAVGAVMVRAQRILHLQSEAANRAHELTVSYACHELRNPLHALAASTALLGESISSMEEELLNSQIDERTSSPSRSDGSVNDPQRSQLAPPFTQDALSTKLFSIVKQFREDTQTIFSATEALQIVTNDLLDLQRLRTGKLEIRPRYVQFRKLISRTVELHMPLAKAPMSFWVDPSVSDDGFFDPLRLQQVLSNGLTNACKHAVTPGADIMLAVWLDGPKLSSSHRKHGIHEARPQQVFAGHLRDLPDTAWFQGRSPFGVLPPDSSNCKCSKHRIPEAERLQDPEPPLAALECLEPAVHDGVVAHGFEAYWVNFEISDSGPGLHGAAGCQLFEPFAQGGATSATASETFNYRRADAAKRANIPQGKPSTPRMIRGSSTASAPSTVHGTPTAAGSTTARGTTNLDDTPTAASGMAKHGSGLGLALTGSLVRMMGGQVALVETQKRTRLIMRLPLALLSSNASPASPARPSSPTCSSDHMSVPRPPALANLSVGSLPAGVGSPLHQSGVHIAVSVHSMAEDTDGYLRAPRRVSPNAKDKDEAQSKSSHSKHTADVHAHILVVEDDPTNRKLVQRMLRNLGSSCELLEDGEDAAALLKARGHLSADPPQDPSDHPKFDFILMDIVMPRSNGALVTQDLKMQGLDIPVFAMTANTSTADVSMYRACGMEEFIVAKPFSSYTLLQTLHMVMSREIT